MRTSGSPRKLALGIYLSLLFAMALFALLAGHPNQGLLAMSAAARLIFCMGAAAGIVTSLSLLRRTSSPATGTADWATARSRGGSQRALRLLMAFLALSVTWSLAWFGLLQRLSLLLDGPISREPARLQRPLSPGSPAWCGHFTKVRTESGYIGTLCMERINGRSELIPLLGCVPLDAPATIQIARTFLGPVGSLLEVTDVDGKCARKRSKR